MVEILHIFNIDISTICATLLFPLQNNSVMIEAILHKIFHQKINTIIYDVRNTKTIYNFRIIHKNITLHKQVDHIDNILLTMIHDFRYIIIKLADYLLNLRRIKYIPENKLIFLAREYYSIYVPLANRFGMRQPKWEIEDYYFRHFKPFEYKSIAKLLRERRIDRERYIEQFVCNLNESMKKNGIEVKIYGRPKHIYSIWRKMQKKNLTFDKIFDVYAVRIIAEQLKYCYTALEILHTNFNYLPSEFDDYIIHPKPNGYQSIHTVVFGPDSKTIEIQIRTKQMHKNAELGIAAHWKYKENTVNSLTTDITVT